MHAFQTAKRVTVALLVVLAGCGGSGDDGAKPAASAGGSFSAVTAMSAARTSASAVLLADGRVLVAGGANSTSLATTEIFDPATGRWSAGATMTTKHVATTGEFLVRLQDDRILALTGLTAEIYDPVTQQWSAVAPPPGPIAPPFQLLADGRVLTLSLAGTVVHAYDAVRDTWQTWSGFDGRRNFAVARLTDGRVLVSGGRLGTARTATTLLFSPTTGLWQSGPTMSFTRSDHFSFVLNDGRIVVSHGTQDGSTTGLPSEIYDPATNRWSLAGNVIKFDASTIGASCTQLADGSWLVAGGQTPAGASVLDQVPQGLLNETNAEIFDPRTLQWRRATPPPAGLVVPRHHHTATRLRDGRVLIAGGLSGVALPNAEVFRP